MSHLAFEFSNFKSQVSQRVETKPQILQSSQYADMQAANEPAQKKVNDLLQALANHSISPVGIAKKFVQTSKRCNGSVPHTWMSNNIVECHKVISDSFEISNIATKMDLFDKNNNLLVRGYTRFVNSDCGPYLEINSNDVCWENLSLYASNWKRKNPYFLD